jgi:hypothetical protein
MLYYLKSTMPTLQIVVLAACLLSASSAWAANYYVDAASGNDHNAGTSFSAPWRSLWRVNNGAVYGPGDQILLRGGQTFSGTISLNPNNLKGTGAAPVLISSYNGGRAVISGASRAIYVHNNAGITISNVVCVGPGNLNSRRESGISFYTDRTTDGLLDHVFIDNVDVSGYHDGIYINGTNLGTTNARGYINVSITNSNLHDNRDMGLCVAASWNPAWINVRNLIVRNVRAFNNPGIVGKNSGYGIFATNTIGGIIENCTAYNNGSLGGDPNGGAGCGIMLGHASGITIQRNECYLNQSLTGCDGVGIDLDLKVSNCTVQYNYCHNNDGPGLYTYRALADNIIRYNISENDMQDSIYPFGGITIVQESGKPHVYNNSVFMSSAVTGRNSGRAAIKFRNDAFVRNNIFVTTGGVPLVNGSGSFQGNNYWTSGGPFIINSDSTYNSLAEFRASGQEMLGDTPVGMNVDPRFVNSGDGGTVFPNALTNLNAYQLQTGSIMIDAGLDLQALFGLQVGGKDFFGDGVPQGGSYDLGAHEYSGAVTLPSNRPATVSLSTNGASFTAPASISLTAAAPDSDGAINRVEFYQDGTLLGADASGPYAITWNDVGAGGYIVTARAVDNAGATSMSNAVFVTVNAPIVFGVGIGVQQIEQLYREVLGRAPDPAGLVYWVGQLKIGVPANTIREMFCDSAECAAKINSLYQKNHGRNASAELTSEILFLKGGGMIAQIQQRLTAPTEKR